MPDSFLEQKCDLKEDLNNKFRISRVSQTQFEINFLYPGTNSICGGPIHEGYLPAMRGIHHAVVVPCMMDIFHPQRISSIHGGYYSFKYPSNSLR